MLQVLPTSELDVLRGEITAATQQLAAITAEKEEAVKACQAMEAAKKAAEASTEQAERLRRDAQVSSSGPDLRRNDACVVTAHHIQGCISTCSLVRQPTTTCAARQCYQQLIPFYLLSNLVLSYQLLTFRLAFRCFQGEAHKALALAEEEKSSRLEAQRAAELAKHENDQRARSFKDAVKASVSKVQHDLEAERDELRSALDQVRY